MVVRSDATAAESFGDKTAEGEETVSIDSGPMRGTPLKEELVFIVKACHVSTTCRFSHLSVPPTVGKHPLVDPEISGLLDLSDGRSLGDLCAVGDVCRRVLWAAAGADLPGEFVGEG